MKLIVKCLLALTVGVALIAEAGVAADVSTPAYRDIRFSKNSVALITERGAYSFDRQMKEGKPISGTLPNAFFPSTNPKKLDGQAEINTWKTANGIEFQTIDAYCGEGAEMYHSLLYRGKRMATYLPRCESINALEVVDGHLWLGSYEQYEYGRGQGLGVRIISLETKKLLAAFSPSEKSLFRCSETTGRDEKTKQIKTERKCYDNRAGGGRLVEKSLGLLAHGSMLHIRHDPFSKDVWILTETALHRVSNMKAISRWYLSEQFNSDGQVTLQASLKPQKSNPWAMLVRHTKLKDSKSIWSQLKLMPQLAKRLTYEYDELGDHFKLDGKLFNPSGGFVYDEYRFTAQEIIDELKNRK